MKIKKVKFCKKKSNKRSLELFYSLCEQKNVQKGCKSHYRFSSAVRLDTGNDSISFHSFMSLNLFMKNHQPTSDLWASYGI